MINVAMIMTVLQMQTLEILEFASKITMADCFLKKLFPMRDILHAQLLDFLVDCYLVHIITFLSIFKAEKSMQSLGMFCSAVYVIKGI